MNCVGILAVPIFPTPAVPPFIKAVTASPEFKVNVLGATKAAVAPSIVNAVVVTPPSFTVKNHITVLCLVVMVYICSTNK